MAWYDDLFSTGLTVAGMRKAQTDLEAMGLNAANAASGVAQEGLTQTGFKPFTVTTGVGGATTTPTGGFTTTLSPQQQALQNTLFGGSGQLAEQATAAYDPRYAQLANQAYGGVGGLMSQAQQASLDAGSMDRGAREQQVYEQLRALQSPEEERQRLALENRLSSQGRLGVSTAQYGGTPEQLAMAKAQAEGQNQASLMAMQQSGAEQQQALQRASGLQGLTSGMFGMGTQARMTPRQIQAADLQNLGGMMSAGYAPDAQLMNALGLGTNLSQIAGLGQRAGANLYGEAELSGIQAQLEAQQRSAELERSMFSSLAQFAGSKDQSGKGLLGQILSGLGGGGTTTTPFEDIKNLPIFDEWDLWG